MIRINMKKIALLFLAAAFSCATAFADDAPAFPGAEGHGRYTTGGRASNGTTKVYHVTNLNDSGTGSLRWALSQSGPRTIVFDVAGYIDLKSQLNIPGNTTIAGQTAPYPGITLRYYTVYLNGSNIIIRFIRSRRSQVKDVNESADAIWGREKSNIIIDHCSFSWSIDEVASFYDNNNFTLQWSSLGESLNNAGHDKGAHGYGGIWGGKLASFHHNLIAHVNNRAPRFNGARYKWSGYTSNKLYNQYQWKNTVLAENVDFRNCVMYDWGSGSCYGGPGGGQINIVNNYYKAYSKQSSNKNVITQVSIGYFGNASSPTDYWGMTSRYYIKGNYNANKSIASYDWSGVKYDGTVTNKQDSKNQCPTALVGVSYKTHLLNGEYYSEDPNNYYGDDVEHTTIDGVSCVKIKLDSPCPTGEVTTQSSETAYEKVLAYVGSSLYRDAVDTRYMDDVKNGTATYTGPTTKKSGQIDIINDPNSATQDETLPSFPELESTSRPADFDADNDGMADAWEQANGGDLNPNEYTLDSTKKWYTNLEVYLSSLVEGIMKAGNADAESSVDEYYPESQSTSVSSASINSTVKRIEYYTLDGRQLDTPQSGISIRKMTLSNGKTITDKVIKK